MRIDIKDLNKAEVLAALYNNTKAPGMGWLSYEDGDMTSEEAQELLDSQGTYFDYLKGRVMKVNLSEDFFLGHAYDRDNGEGAAERAILPLRSN